MVIRRALVSSSPLKAPLGRRGWAGGGVQLRCLVSALLPPPWLSEWLDPEPPPTNPRLWQRSSASSESASWQPSRTGPRDHLPVSELGSSPPRHPAGRPLSDLGGPSSPCGSGLTFRVWSLRPGGPRSPPLSLDQVVGFPSPHGSHGLAG